MASHTTPRMTPAGAASVRRGSLACVTKEGSMRIPGVVQLIAGVAFSSATLASAALAESEHDGILRKAARGEIRRGVLRMQVVKDGKVVTIVRPLPFLSSGTIAAAQQANG